MSTKFYLGNLAQSYSLGDPVGDWANNPTGAIVEKKLVTSKTGGGDITSITDNTQITSGPRDLLYRGISEPLATQTISGTVNVMLGFLDTVPSSDLTMHVHIYVLQGTSTTLRGTLLSNYSDSTVFPTSTNGGTTFASDQTLTSLAISNGDHLVAEIGYQPPTNETYDGRLYYGTTVSGSAVSDLVASPSGNSTNTAGYLVFSGTITTSSGTTYNQTGSGGVVGDGSAVKKPLEILRPNLTPSGVLGAGTAVKSPLEIVSPKPPTSAALAGSQALLTASYTISGNGGCLGGGTAVVRELVNPKITASGVLVGGSANVEIPIGGVKLGSSAIAWVDYLPAETGGGIVGGSAVPRVVRLVSGSGGVLCGGSATMPVVYRVPITIPAGSVTEDLDNFLLSVRATLNTAHVVSQSFGFVSGGKGRASKVVSYNPSTGLLDAIVKVPIHAASDTVVLLYYN